MTDAISIQGATLAEALSEARRRFGPRARVVRLDQPPWWKHLLGGRQRAVTVWVEPSDDQGAPASRDVERFGELLRQLTEGEPQRETLPLDEASQELPSSYRLATRGLAEHGVREPTLRALRQQAAATLGVRPMPAVGLIKGWLTLHLQQTIRCWNPGHLIMRPGGWNIALVVPDARRESDWVVAVARDLRRAGFRPRLSAVGPCAARLGRQNLPVHALATPESFQPSAGIDLIVCGANQPPDDVDIVVVGLPLTPGSVESALPILTAFPAGMPLAIGWHDCTRRAAYGPLVELALRRRMFQYGRLEYPQQHPTVLAFREGMLRARLIEGPRWRSRRRADRVQAAAGGR